MADNSTRIHSGVRSAGHRTQNFTRMVTEEFGKRYLQYEQDIEKVLRKQKIYDEDLMHDTYIALYEHSQQAEIKDFVNTFVAFYKNLCKRQKMRENYYVVCDDREMVEKYDRVDEDDWKRREQDAERVDNLIGYYCAHSHLGERNHQRACDILKLYREGLSYVEIAKRLKIDESTVKKYFKRTIKRLKGHGEVTTI